MIDIEKKNQILQNEVNHIQKLKNVSIREIEQNIESLQQLLEEEGQQYIKDKQSFLIYDVLN